jgi:hypothetical protein
MNTKEAAPSDYRTVMNQDCECQFIAVDGGKDTDVLFCELHAAAPDLLAALNAILTITAQNGGNEWKGSDAAALSAIELAASAAILRATGGK